MEEGKKGPTPARATYDMQEEMVRVLNAVTEALRQTNRHTVNRHVFGPWSPLMNSHVACNAMSNTSSRMTWDVGFLSECTQNCSTMISRRVSPRSCRRCGRTGRLLPRKEPETQCRPRKDGCTLMVIHIRR